jgi:hypothetical protein
MKKCIVQYWIPSSEYTHPGYNNLLKNSNKFDADGFANRSARSFELYANKYNHDFVRVTEKKLNYKHPTFERFDLWLDDHWWEKYDEIMYVDSDVFAMPEAPDIFQHYKSLGTFKVCEHDAFQKATLPEQIDLIHHGLLKKCKLDEVKHYGFQPGVFILTKTARDIMRPYIEQFKELNDHDGHILIWACIQSQVPLTRMSRFYNYKKAYFKRHPESYFFHAAGHKKLVHLGRIYDFLEKKGLQ